MLTGRSSYPSNEAARPSPYGHKEPSLYITWCHQFPRVWRRRSTFHIARTARSGNLDAGVGVYVAFAGFVLDVAGVPAMPC